MYWMRPDNRSMAKGAAFAMEEKPKKHIGGLIMLAVLIALTFYMLLRNLELQELWRVICSANPWYLLIGFGMVLLFLAGEGQCYRVMLRGLGEQVRFLPSFVYACVDFYFSAITPSATGGQPAVVYYMGKDGIPVAKGGMVLLLYTVVYKAVLMTLGLVSICLYPRLILEGEWYFKLLFAFGVTVNIVVMAVFLLAMFSNTLMLRVCRFLVVFGHKIRLVRHPADKLTALEHHLEEYRQSAAYIRRNPAMPLQVYGWATAQRLAMFLVSFWVYRSLGYTQLSPVYLLVIQVLISIAVDSLPLPGAVGAAEKMFLTLYSTIYAAGQLEPALLLTRGLNYYGCLILCSMICIVNHQRGMCRKA